MVWCVWVCVVGSIFLDFHIIRFIESLNDINLFQRKIFIHLASHVSPVKFMFPNRKDRENTRWLEVKSNVCCRERNANEPGLRAWFFAVPRSGDQEIRSSTVASRGRKEIVAGSNVDSEVDSCTSGFREFAVGENGWNSDSNRKWIARYCLSLGLSYLAPSLPLVFVR